MTGNRAFDAEAVHAKYLAERDKRLVPGRADIRDLTSDEHFAAVPPGSLHPGHASETRWSTTSTS